MTAVFAFKKDLLTLSATSAQGLQNYDFCFEVLPFYFT